MNMHQINKNTHTGIRLLVAVLLLAAMLSCAPRSQLLPGEETGVGYTTFKDDKETYPPESGLFPDYSLVPGDVLDVLFQIKALHGIDKYTITANDTITIKFVQLPELNETQRVRPDGKMSLAYIGDVNVVGLTPDQLQKLLIKRYSKYLRHPEIYVTIDEFRQRIKELKKDLHTASRGLSRLVTVRPDGYATFPLMGDLLVGHKTLPQVKEELDNYYQSYLKGLHVDLFLQEYAGSVVYVLGQVTKPGSYKFTKPITVLEAMALAAGPTTEADMNDIMIFRRDGNKFKSTVVDLSQAIATTQDGTFFYLKPDDVVYVTESGIFEAGRVAKALSQIIMFRGWGISWGGNAFDLPGY